MTRNRQDGLYLLLLGSVIFVVAGSAMKVMTNNSAADFKGVYNATQCLLEHRDPYRVNINDDSHQEFTEKNSPGFNTPNRIVPLYNYLPSSIVFFLPFAVLPWEAAQVLWTIILAIFILMAGFLTWEIGANFAPRLSGGLIFILFANCAIVFQNGNPAGIAVGACVIGAWCIMTDRFVPLGIVCFAMSLAIKPHDSGLVWLCFLLAGGTFRRRSILVLSAVILLCIPSLFWIWHIAPHWIPELQSNLARLGGRGNVNDPGPMGPFSLSIQPIIDLQAAVSFMRDDPGVYNPISYAICGILLLIWSLATLRANSSRDNLWFSLAIAAVMTMLVTYHRPYDAKLLLLAVPAFAILWSEGGITGWLALLTSTCGMVFTSEIPLAVIGSLAKKLPIGGGGLAEKLLTVVITRPASPALLVMAVFYLWAYEKRCSRPSSVDRNAPHISVLEAHAE